MNKRLEDTIEDLRKGGSVTVSLMLTKYCPFACAHCFYGCGPDLPKEYMSDDVLYRVRDFVEELARLNIMVDINLIGGEPTADLKEFARALGFVSNWMDATGDYIRVSMVTNGWFLHDRNIAREFFEIVQPYLPPDGDPENGNGLTISISDDQYHRMFRPAGFPRVQTIIDHITGEREIDTWAGPYEMPLLARLSMYECLECGTLYYPDDKPEECSTCGSKHIEPSYTVDIDLPPNRENGSPWLSTHGELDINGVIPSGGRGGWGRNDLMAGYLRTDDECHAWRKITFDSDGQLTDGCCRGSMMPFGSVDDYPLVLLYLTRHFQTNTPCLTCRKCLGLAEKFASTEAFATLKQSLIEEVAADEDVCGWYDDLAIQVPEEEPEAA